LRRENLNGQSGEIINTCIVMKKHLGWVFLFMPLLLSSQSYSVQLTPLPPGINTPDNEELGRWSVDGKTLLFSRIGKTSLSLYAAHFDGYGKLSDVEKFPFDSTYHGGGHAISPDGKNLILTICNRNDGFGSCDLYWSQRWNDTWSAPVNLGPAVNGNYWDGQPAFGMDGTTLYFASNRPGGKGGRDIWVAHEISPGHWSRAVNAGPGINTADDEGSPFIHFDGRTLYFMRDGKGGLGGYDLYVSRIGIDGQWMNAVNLGSPINSNANEGGLALRPDGMTAVITKSTPSQGNDLFEFQLPTQFQSKPIQALHVHITNSETHQPVAARLEIFDANGNDTIRQSQLADEKGNITVTLDRNTGYGIIASADKYVLNSIHLQPTQEPLRVLDIEMVPLSASVARPIGLQNIFFNTGSYSILPASEPELNSLAKALQNNPAMKIEIRGYTDNVGSAGLNQELSENRAKAVFTYLTEKGIAADRLSYKGFGEEHPLADNATEEGRRQNRRTEFVITALK
jgi:outer membrane protein OmpA-like peptidoglycan-associated protein